MIQRHIAVLIPGFLGFERGANFSLFADRIASVVGPALEDRLGGRVPVVIVSSLPTTSLADRQVALLRQIAEQTQRFDEVEQIHLIGHGIGGIDAQLLSCTGPLSVDYWRQLPGVDPAGIAAKVRSVVSIATPHRGMELANDYGADALSPAAMLRDPAGARHVLEAVRLLVGSAWSTIDPRDFAFGALREGRKVSQFLGELASWQGLVRNLTPMELGRVYRSVEPRTDVRRRSFVTVAGRPLSDSPAAQPDGFFLEMSRRAAGSSEGFLETGPGLVASLARIRARAAEPGGLLVSDSSSLPADLDVTSNDGVVNTARQLLSPQDPDELVQVVVADHFDVAGYYHRRTWKHDAKGRSQSRAVLSGLFRSGSHFRDPEFFALYRSVAEAVSDSGTKSKARKRPAAEKRTKNSTRKPVARPDV